MDRNPTRWTGLRNYRAFGAQAENNRDERLTSTPATPTLQPHRQSRRGQVPGRRQACGAEGR